MKKMISMVLCIVLSLSLVGCGAKTTINGRYCETTNGQSLILSEKEGAICISLPPKGENLFTGLENGDEIEIVVDGVDETYPAQATVYDYTLIQKGSVKDLDSEELQKLVELGWEFPFTVDATDVTDENAR